MCSFESRPGLRTGSKAGFAKREFNSSFLELIAANHSVEEIRRFVEADSVADLSLSGLRQAASDDRHDYCYPCYTGDYPADPINIDDLMQAKDRREYAQSL